MKNIENPFFLFVLLSALFVFGCRNYSGPKFVAFNGVFVDKNGEYKLFPERSNVSPKERGRVIATLTYYGIDSRVLNGQVEISETAFGDLNLLFNITEKANDSVWFADHIGRDW